MQVQKVTDKYFNNCREIAVRTSELSGRLVRYKVFARENGIMTGTNKAVNFIFENTYGPLNVYAFKDGESFKAGDPVMIIEGIFSELVNLETTYLGFVSFSGSATEMFEIVEAADGVPVIDMSARHFPWQIIEEAALAAYLGGAAGTSTEAGCNYVHHWYPESVGKFNLYASLPHAMAAVVCDLAEKDDLFPSVKAALLFHQTYPEKPITVLVDYEGCELDVAKQAFEVFGDKLFAVRLDTHGGRQHQGTIELESLDGLLRLSEYFYSKTGMMFEDVVSMCGMPFQKIQKYLIGNGVTVEATFVMREFLDSIGAKNVKIVVSSGFNKEKITVFRKTGAPMDAIGTGSWVRFMMFTADIYEVFENGVWVPRTKVGRTHGSGDNLPLQLERK